MMKSLDESGRVPTVRRDAIGGWMRVSVAACLLSVVACGGVEPQELDAEPGVQMQTHGLRPTNGWRKWTVTPDDPGTTQTFVDNPAVCLATPDGVLIVGRDEFSNRFRMLVNQWRLFSAEPVWADAGSATFASKPGCTALDEVVSGTPSNVNGQVAIVGRRASDNKFYTRVYKLDTELGDWPNDPPEHPAAIGTFGKISDDVYASGPGTTVANRELLVVGRRSDDRLYLHRNPLSTSTTSPYNASNWRAAIAVPALPTGVAVGDPAIANTRPINGTVTIMTRVRVGSANRLYYIFWDGSAFTSWFQLPTGNTVVSSDPALEVDVGVQHVNLMTVFIRGATSINGTVTNRDRIFQASGAGPNLWEEFSIVRPEDNDTFANPSAPAAVGSGNFEGEHLVVAKKSDKRFYWESPVPF